MSHERFSERILDLAYGELSPREAGKVEAHAASCAECGADARDAAADGGAPG